MGKPVKCPKCQAGMIVPGSQAAAGDSHTSSRQPDSGDSSALESAESDDPADDPLALDLSSPPGLADVEVSLEPPDLTRTGERSQATSTQETFSQRSGNNVMRTASASSRPDRTVKKQQSPAASKEETSHCSNCNHPQPIDHDLCDACGYHKILKKVLDPEGLHRQDKATGFERFLKKQLSEGETAESALVWAKLAVGVGTIVLLVLIAQCMGPVAAVICLVGVIGLVAWTVLQKKVSHDSSKTNQDMLSSVVWTGFLSLQRVCGWRLLEWPFPKTRVLTMHDTSFNDGDLQSMHNLDSFQTLDLERTQISDEGLVQLAGLDGLRFLVLRQTQVTPEGIQGLQTQLDQTMIWY